LLVHLPLPQVMYHRSLWAFVFFTVFLWFTKRRLSEFFSLTFNQKLMIFISSGLLGLNWSVYLFAVSTNQVMEGSLGYFINPLINFSLGFLFLGERMPLLRRYAVALAVLGVLWLTFLAGSFPWIGLSLAITFGLYGLIRKVSKTSATNALQIESLILSFIWFLAFSVLHPSGSLVEFSWSDGLLLIGSGIVTGIPLYWFSKAVQTTPLNVLGFLQFISPTLQFLLGFYIYKEVFPPQKLIGFLFIWSAVLLLVFELIYVRSRRKSL
jgi:chloramphenicol-sensitive protein RarD